MKQVAGHLRLDLAQYNELAAFAQFGSELDKASQMQLARGERLVELLKQAQYEPMPFEKQVVAIFAGVNGFLDDLPVGEVRRFEKELLDFVASQHPDIPRDLVAKRELAEDIKGRLKAAVESFSARFKAGLKK